MWDENASLQSDAQETVTDLFQKKPCQLITLESKDQWATVDAVSPEIVNEEEERLPARHVKYVWAHVDNGDIKKWLCLSQNRVC